MSYSVNGNNITLTRGDTLRVTVIPKVYDSIEGAWVTYIPQDGDQIRFAMKKAYGNAPPLLVKQIPIDTCILLLRPDQTKEFDFGKYVYDIEITYNDGNVDTFIKGTITLTEEVD